MNMNRRTLALLCMTMVLALAFAGTTHASNQPVVIYFEKDCPAFTCTETAASPVDVATTITSGWLSGYVFHYTATETISSAVGSVTLDLAGVLVFPRDPNLTVLDGTVTSGAWNGVDLAGARVHASAVRVTGTTFAGSVQIMPASAG